MLTRIKIKGTLNEAGQIDLELPANWQAGEIIIEISILTDDELEELLQSKPKPADEIITGGWEEVDITDSAEWVEKLRGRT